MTSPRKTAPAAGVFYLITLGQSLMPAINALLLGTLLYRSRLVPRIIPVIGLIGAASTAASYPPVTEGIAR